MCQKAVGMERLAKGNISGVQAHSQSVISQYAGQSAAPYDVMMPCCPVRTDHTSNAQHRMCRDDPASERR